MRSIPKFRPSSSDTEFLVSLLVIIARFTRILCGGGCSHAIHFLGVLINLPVYHVFLASIAGFLTWLPSGAFFWIISHDFTLLQVVSRDMQLDFFPFGHLVFPITCICFLVLASSSLIGVGCQGVFSSPFTIYVTSTIGICPVYCIRRCSSFLKLFSDFHYYEHTTSPFISFTLKIQLLEVGLLVPSIWDYVKQNIVDLCFIHILDLVELW